MSYRSAGFASCDECKRHVRAGDDLCPFCGAHVRQTALPVDDRLAVRLTRAGILAGALAASACASPTPVVVLYGGPPAPDTAPVSADAGLTDATASDAMVNDAAAPSAPVAASLYGAPPVDPSVPVTKKPDTRTSGPRDGGGRSR